MRRTITDTADRLRPGDRIKAPNSKWMLVSDITYATSDGILGALAVLLVDAATSSTYGARLVILGSGYTLDIQRDNHFIRRPYPAAENTKVRRRSLSYEVWDSVALEWVYILPGTWKEEFGGALEADERLLNSLCEADPADNPEVQRIVAALRTSHYQRTAEHALDASQEVVDQAIKLGLVRVVQVKSTTYNRKGERMLAAV